MRCSDLIDLKTTLLAYTRIPRMKLKKKLKIKLIGKKTLDSTIYFFKIKLRRSRSNNSINLAG